MIDLKERYRWLGRKSHTLKVPSKSVRLQPRVFNDEVLYRKTLRSEFFRRSPRETGGEVG